MPKVFRDTSSLAPNLVQTLKQVSRPAHDVLYALCAGDVPMTVWGIMLMAKRLRRSMAYNTIKGRMAELVLLELVTTGETADKRTSYTITDRGRNVYALYDELDWSKL